MSGLYSKFQLRDSCLRTKQLGFSSSPGNPHVQSGLRTGSPGLSVAVAPRGPVHTGGRALPSLSNSMGLAEDQGFASIHVPGCSDGLWATLEGTSALKPQSCYTGGCKGPIPPADGAGTFLPCPSFWLGLGCPKMWARGWTGSLCVGEGPALAYMASSRLCV